MYLLKIVSLVNNNIINQKMSIDPNKELFDSPPTMNELAMGSGGGGSGGSGGGSGDGPSAPPPASSPPAIQEEEGIAVTDRGGSGGEGDNILHLTVTDPQEIGEGRNRHTYYRIDVRAPGTTSNYSDPLSSVRRRYSDFQWLFQRLHAERPGAIIPIIPHTQAMQSAKRFSDELIEMRRGHLEKFLRRVQIHPELEGAPSLAAFFSPDAEIFEAAKRANPSTSTDETVETTVAENAKEKIKHFFVKTGLKVSVMRGNELEETSDGAAFEDVENYLNTLNTHVKSLSKSTLFLVDTSQETSKTMHELGQTLFGLFQTYDPAKLDNSNQSTSSTSLPSLKSISNVFASLSAIHKVKHDENYQKVAEPIHDLEWSIKAARLALKRRKERQLTYNTYLQQIKNRTATLDKLKQNSPPSPETQIVNAQKALDVAKNSRDGALDDLDVVSQRVFREMDRFKESVDESLRRIYVGHAKIQMDYSRQLDTEWGKLSSGLGNSGNKPGASGKNGTGTSSNDVAEVLMI